MHRLLVKTAQDMIRFGEVFGSMLKGGEVIVLSGDLGAGKTTFVQGVARGMGIVGPVTSPSFALIHVHEGFLVPNLVHCDFYRLHSDEDVEGTGFYDYLEADNVVIVEWGEMFLHVLPENVLHITIRGVELGREMLVATRGELGIFLVEEWIEKCLH